MTEESSFKENSLISVRKTTRAALKALGKKGESYDDIIQRLLGLAREGGE